MADSRITDAPNDSTLTNGQTITHTEHNTHRTNYRTAINNNADVIGDLEDNYASSVEPTSKPNGKLWYDTTATEVALKSRVAGAWKRVIDGVISGGYINIRPGNNELIEIKSADTNPALLTMTQANDTSASIQNGLVFRVGTTPAIKFRQGVDLTTGDLVFSKGSSLTDPALKLNASGAVTFSGETTFGDTVSATKNIVMASGKGLDFSVDTKGIFDGLESVVYRLNTNITNDDDPLGSSGSEWEISDDVSNENQLGVTTVTESNGVFTFGATGYWSIEFFGTFNDNSAKNVTTTGMHSEIGAGFVKIAEAISSTPASGDFVPISMGVVLKVENSAHTFKAAFATTVATGRLVGNTAYNLTYLVFTKLADL